jgi:hypothetical protein
VSSVPRATKRVESTVRAYYKSVPMNSWSLVKRAGGSGAESSVGGVS